MPKKKNPDSSSKETGDEIEARSFGHGQFGDYGTTDKLALPGRRSDGARVLPSFDLSDSDWRAATHKPAFPSGYTYLAQLMGHDIGHTVPARLVPHARPEKTRPNEIFNAFDQRQNPLTLETVYGLGPAATPHLYTRETLRFRVPPRSQAIKGLAPKFCLPTDNSKEGKDTIPLRLLADERNRNTIMLHEITVVWMRYHNMVAQVLTEREGVNGTLGPSRGFWFRLHAEARSIVLNTWHTIIMEDLLPQICHADVLALSADDMKSVHLLSQVNVLNGIMRSFHGLPLNAYVMGSNESIPLSQLRNLKKEEKWHVNWSAFFENATSNRTSVAASYADGFASGNAIRVSDLNAAKANGATLGFHQTMVEAQQTLPPHLRRDLSVKALTKEMNKLIALETGPAFDERETAEAPLFWMLMMDAQIYGKDRGTFGPFGSALLKRYLEHTIEKLSDHRLDHSFDEWPEPKTISALITLVNNYN